MGVILKLPSDGMKIHVHTPQVVSEAYRNVPFQFFLLSNCLVRPKNASQDYGPRHIRQSLECPTSFPHNLSKPLSMYS